MSQPEKVPKVFYAVFDTHGRELARFDTRNEAKVFVKRYRNSVEWLFPVGDMRFHSGLTVSGARDESQNQKT